MTRREFDRATKRIMGKGLARDERCLYREQRRREHHGSGSDFSTWTVDKVQQRADEVAVLRRRDPGIAALALGTRFRAPMCVRYLGRFPRLLEEQVYYSCVVPWEPDPRRRSIWHPDRPTFAPITRGAFDTEREAHTWAASHLGTDATYIVKAYARPSCSPAPHDLPATLRA